MIFNNSIFKDMKFNRNQICKDIRLKTNASIYLFLLKLLINAIMYRSNGSKGNYPSKTQKDPRIIRSSTSERLGVRRDHREGFRNWISIIKAGFQAGCPPRESAFIASAPATIEIRPSPRNEIN